MEQNANAHPKHLPVRHHAKTTFWFKIPVETNKNAMS
jgi:hypothetical protein